MFFFARICWNISHVFSTMSLFLQPNMQNNYQFALDENIVINPHPNIETNKKHLMIKYHLTIKTKMKKIPIESKILYRKIKSSNKQRTQKF